MKIRRNSKCSCGSGKKYKVCCGFNSGVSIIDSIDDITINDKTFKSNKEAILELIKNCQVYTLGIISKYMAELEMSTTSDKLKNNESLVEIINIISNSKLIETKEDEDIFYDEKSWNSNNDTFPPYWSIGQWGSIWMDFYKNGILYRIAFYNDIEKSIMIYQEY